MSIKDVAVDTLARTDRPAEVDLTEATVRQVALGGWRVSDSLLRDDDPRHLLGYIEIRDDQFEVMVVGADFTWALFPTMPGAIEHLLTVGRREAVTRAASGLSSNAMLPRTSLDDL
ncbi:hypothetical protein [Marisediminicola sp. LYQ134]|uniref:hypothetical protein n=1 Tax=Marisediminicola sp. LYQ134 TaxID=3391061 RepID=UPI00398395CC